MNNSNLVIKGLWIGDELSPMEQLCIKSYINNGHEFHLYIYEDVKNIPSSAKIMDANIILPKSAVYVDEFGGYVNLSNQFRYTLLYKLGGWWVDMDTVCIKPFDFSATHVFSSESSNPYKRILANTTYIKTPAGEQFLLDCLNFLKSRGTKNIHWGELGVNLISRMIFRNQLSRYIMSPQVFCPYSVYDFDKLIFNNESEISTETYAIHWWHEIWKRRNINKYDSFEPNSLYGKLKKKYQISINSTL